MLEAHPILIGAAAHDRQLAWTSHLPQAVAYALAKVLADRKRLVVMLALLFPTVILLSAVATLTPRQREMLGLSLPRIGPVPVPVKPAVLVVLGVLKLGLGRQGPSEAAALRRIRRVTR